ncbi:hypothetical protein HS088_TW15G00561 [Tripterygium wilfordii]|uniref:Uncharacterized protein n=1 Tax=Tripterygium wilfordii TaxID=458696 RepID=A0A7J7CLW0_TRIWF|nr:uncharacterized protein LOC120016179 [Tripterygium wilfordii]KAF5735062.1 hypothetical protein HS088_TW15G00561 [Tripterygium wilfordii]
MEYIDEEEAWKCPKHPSKRRRLGICHVCLRERLASLCPDCANERPCSCSATTSSSSSSSSSFSRFSIAGGEISGGGIGSVGRVSNLIESEPAFRRSRSLAIPFLRSKPSVGRDFGERLDMSEAHKNKNSSSFLSFFKFSKSKRYDIDAISTVSVEAATKRPEISVEDERRSMMRKSRSVAVTSDSGIRDSRAAPSKGKGWHFPSPMKVFRQSKISRVVHERSPLYRG